MNYTYEQFMKAAQDAGLWESFSEADRRLAQNNPDAGMSLLQYKKDYAGSTNEQARILANAGANGIRKQYGGYTGGSDGSGYALTGEGNGSFNSASNEQANALLELLKNRPAYSYDASTDTKAQAVRKEYAREGQRATQDTMGAHAALTGGMPSSAATAAAAQAGNYYAAQSADKLSDLEQIAYDRYQTEGDDLKDQWSMYREQADNEYNRWLTEKNLATEQEREEYDRQYNLAVLAAQYGDYSKLEALGVDVSSWSGGSSSGSSSSSKKKTGDETPTGLDAATLNNLWMTYDGGEIPSSVWTTLAAKYGEEALTDAGFRKKTASAGQSGNSGGQADKTKPGSKSSDRMNMLM